MNEQDGTKRSTSSNLLRLCFLASLFSIYGISYGAMCAMGMVALPIRTFVRKGRRTSSIWKKATSMYGNDGNGSGATVGGQAP